MDTVHVVVNIAERCAPSFALHTGLFEAHRIAPLRTVTSCGRDVNSCAVEICRQDKRQHSGDCHTSFCTVRHCTGAIARSHQMSMQNMLAQTRMSSRQSVRAFDGNLSIYFCSIREIILERRQTGKPTFQNPNGPAAEANLYIC